MTADEALWAAKRAYGGIEQAKELHRDERSLLWLEQTRQDVRFSVRTLVRNPGFTITAVLALAIGIGANTAIFSVINAVLLKPLPFPDARRLVLFVNTANGEDIAVASPAEFNVWRKQTPVLQDVSGYLYSKINLTGVDRPEQVQLAEVSWTYFRLFGLSLARGRAFTAAEDRPRGGDVVIVSESFWKRALSGDPEIIGKKIDLSGKAHEVIGIVAESGQTEAPGTSDPSSFRQTIDMWKPLQIDAGSSDQSGYLTVAARLRSGVTLAASNAELRIATRQFQRAFPGMAQHSVFTVRTMQTILNGEVRNQLSTLSVAVGFVLLIACFNVASLSLSRAIDRGREISIRAAVGASRSRLIRQLLSESVILSIVGGALGVMLGLAGIRGLLTLNSIRIPRIGEYGVGVTADWRVLLFTVVLSVSTGICFGLLPAFQGSSSDINEMLKESAGRSSEGFRRNSARSLLVVAEIAIASVLLIGTSQMIRSFVAERFTNPGFDADNVLAMRISLVAQDHLLILQHVCFGHFGFLFLELDSIQILQQQNTLVRRPKVVQRRRFVANHAQGAATFSHLEMKRCSLTGSFMDLTIATNIGSASSKYLISVMAEKWESKNERLLMRTKSKQLDLVVIADVESNGIWLEGLGLAQASAYQAAEMILTEILRDDKFGSLQLLTLQSMRRELEQTTHEPTPVLVRCCHVRMKGKGVWTLPSVRC